MNVSDPASMKEAGNKKIIRIIGLSTTPWRPI